MVALILITIFGPTAAAAVAWVVAALVLTGAGVGSSPAVRLRGEVNRIDPDSRRRGSG